MSVLEICQNAAKLVGINPPTTLVDSSNVNAQKLLEHLVQAAKVRRREKTWPQLLRTWALTLEDGVANPEMPGDVMGFLNDAFWDIDGAMPLQGPLNSSQWAEINWGLTNTGMFRKFRIAGRIATKRFEISPAPTAGDVGKQIGFIYTSKNWLIPPLWVTGTSYGAGSYVSNSTGLIYKTVAGGTAGSTEPIHIETTASDGGVQWAYFGDPYETPMSDNDISLFDEELMEMDVVWRLRKSMGMDYTEHKAEADRLWQSYYTQSSGAPTLRLRQISNSSFLLSDMNIPDTGYGL